MMLEATKGKHRHIIPLMYLEDPVALFHLLLHPRIVSNRYVFGFGYNPAIRCSFHFESHRMWVLIGSSDQIPVR
jgi:hypothetical protein